MRFHRVTPSRRTTNLAYVQERAERKKVISELRKQHKRDYWEK